MNGPPLHIWCPWCRTFIAKHDAEGVAVANHHADLHMDVAPTATEVEETYVLAPKYDPGDVVQDADSLPGERGSMRILGLEDGTARDIEIPGLGGKSVFEVNLDHPEGSPVYAVAFEGWLDANVGEDRWHQMVLGDEDQGVGDDFGERVRAYCEAWDIPVQSYDYPATRLTPRPRCPKCDERLGWGDDDSLDDELFPGFYSCHNDECDFSERVPAVARAGGEYKPFTDGDPHILSSPVVVSGAGVCDMCDGTGTIDAVPEPMTCPNCDGTGVEP